MFQLFYHYNTVITGHTKLMWLGDTGRCSTHPGSTHHFDVVEPLIDQLLCVLPVGCILWHGLQWRQDLWVEKLQTLWGQKSSTLVGGMSRWGRLLCGVTWWQLGEANELWWTITACIQASPHSVTTPSQQRLCVVCSLTPAHLMWIVGHCQANQAGRLEENSRRDACYVMVHFSWGSFLHSTNFYKEYFIIIIIIWPDGSPSCLLPGTMLLGLFVSHLHLQWALWNSELAY